MTDDSHQDTGEAPGGNHQAPELDLSEQRVRAAELEGLAVEREASELEHQADAIQHQVDTESWAEVLEEAFDATSQVFATERPLRRAESRVLARAWAPVMDKWLGKLAATEEARALIITGIVFGPRLLPWGVRKLEQWRGEGEDLQIGAAEGAGSGPH
ncbi:MAG: hypothetical protein GWO02_05160 [Gammaproteobacteria bacterium]|nr:hypothetical protein [Gammaproteobacteria bacterium]